MINRLSKKAKFNLILGTVTVLAVGAFGWFTYKDWEKVGTLDQESEGLEARIKKADAEIRTIPALEDRVIVLRQNVQEYVNILPDDAEVHAFVDKLTEFASEAGINVNKLDDRAAKQRKTRRGRAATEAFERITYKLELSGTMESLMAFIDRFENKYDRFVRIPSFEVRAFEDRSSSRGNEELDPTTIERHHEIKMDLETFVYNPKTKTSAQPVQIAGEAQKLSRLRAEGRLGHAESDMAFVRYVYDPTKTPRDVFVDPRIFMPANLKISSEVREEQRQVLSGLVNAVSALKDAYDVHEQEKSIVERLRLLDVDDAKLESLRAESQQLKDAEFFTVHELDAEFKDEVLARLDQLAERRGKGQGSSVVTMQSLEKRVEAMEQALAAGEYAKVIANDQEFIQLRQLLPDPRDADDLMVRAEKTVHLANVYIDFSELKFDISGCVCYADNPAHSVIIINGKSYSPGELVADELRITEITPSEITFDFRGYRMVHQHGGS